MAADFNDTTQKKVQFCHGMMTIYFKSKFSLMNADMFSTDLFDENPSEPSYPTALLPDLPKTTC